MMGREISKGKHHEGRGGRGASLQSPGWEDDVKLKEIPRRKAKSTGPQANAVVTATLCHLMKHQ